jgi:hypothetical protein
MAFQGPFTTFKAGVKTPGASVGQTTFSLTPKKSSETPFQDFTLRLRRKKVLNSKLDYDSVSFDWNNGNAPSRDGDVFFRIDESKSLFKSTNSSTIAISGPETRTRGSFAEFVGGNGFLNRYKISKAPWTELDGIDLDTFANGDDLIYAYGIGARDIGDNTFVDRGNAYVNVGSGRDVVVGGYGKDHFGSTRVKDSLGLKNLYGSFDSVTRGNKFFVGGSYDDLLDGGKGDDFLIGDRLNGYELYLPSKALDNVDSRWKFHVDNIGKFQLDESNYRNGAGSALLANDRPYTYGGSESYPLWAPGNDIIRSYESDDIIYGDDSTMDTNLYQLFLIKKWYKNTPKVVREAGGVGTDNWNSIKLGADFIDAGAGNDQVYAGVGADAIIGGGGADVIDIGSQIIAEKYNPFFGPKVVIGDKAEYDPITKAWKGKGRDTPDVFIVGGLYDKEDELKESNSGQLDVLAAQRKSVAEKLDDFEEAWNIAGKVVGKIPKVGGLINGIVNATTSALRFRDPKPAASGKPAVAADAMTVIKDFDSLDQLSISIASGETLKFRKSSFYIGGFDKLNPLGAGTSGSNGVFLEYSKDAGTSYDRVYLQGVKELVILGKSDGNNSDIITLGGSGYASILDDTGKQVYENVVF